MSKAIRSPYIRQCALNEQAICIACYRSIEEITNWADFVRQARLKILHAAKQRRAEET